MTTDDMTLVRAYVRHHSETAFATLVARHINLVYSVALRQVGNPQLAEDITQTTFIILSQKAKSLSVNIILSGWLCRTARFVSANALTLQRRRQAREQEAYKQSMLNETQSNAWTQIEPLLETALAQLGEKEHNAIILRFFEGKDLRTVGAEQGASEDATRMRINRALERMRRFFTKRGIELTPAVIAAAISANAVQAAPWYLAQSVTVVAVGKGAVASGSTLTLAKGTLKLMAWSKLKTTAITSAVLLLGALSTATVTQYFQHLPPRQAGRLHLPTGNVKPMIGAGRHFRLILASDGSLWCWGEEIPVFRVLGLSDPQIHHTVSLRRIGRETNWVNAAVGDTHCLGVKSDGSLWAWGVNTDNELGDDSATTQPVPVPSVPGNDWRQAAASVASSFGLKTNGTLWAWGNNWAGQLGIGSTNRVCFEATQVGASTHWTKVWAKGIQTVAQQADGSLWFWGSLSGTTDTNEVRIPTRISPDTNWTDVGFGDTTVLAIKADGTLWSWGKYAHLYTGSADTNSTMVPGQVGTENDWITCASSARSYHLLTKKDGSLWELDARGNYPKPSKPAANLVKFRKIKLQKPIVATAAGSGGGVVLTRDGEVWTWGPVFGEHSPQDLVDLKRRVELNPKFRIIDQPWQVSNIDAAE
jgi:RNA polymerase sigma factor (sigma-70 family)